METRVFDNTRARYILFFGPMTKGSRCTMKYYIIIQQELKKKKKNWGKKLGKVPVRQLWRDFEEKNRT